jgi:hypothetical protein
MRPNRIDEFHQVRDSVAQSVNENIEVEALVSVHENVAKSGHIAQICGQRGRQPAVAFEQCKEFLVRLGFAQTLVRYDVRTYIQRALDSELQGVRGEALFFDVGFDLVGVHKCAQFPHMGLNCRKLFRDQIRISHGLSGLAIAAQNRQQIEMPAACGDFKIDPGTTVCFADDLAIAQHAMHEIRRRVVQNDQVHGPA